MISCPTTRACSLLPCKHYVTCMHHGSMCIMAIRAVQMMQGNEQEGSSCKPSYKESSATLPALPKQVC